MARSFLFPTNKSAVCTLGIVCTSLFAFSQGAFNPQNARHGETVEYCHQHIKLEELRLSNPSVFQQMKNDQITLAKAVSNYAESKSETVYTIPIVFHIVHNEGTENISDEQVYDAVEILNRDFRRLNSDADLVHADFQGMPSDIMIEFKLATIAPDGTCFNGVTRSKSPYTEAIGSGVDQLTAALYENDIYQGSWPHDKYLNIIVAKDIGGAAGYTYYPSNAGIEYQCIWMLSEYVGSIGTGAPGTSRTLTHEVGHWLNLKHTWGDSNSPGLLSNCNDDDEVDDTPNTIGSTVCNLNENTCGSRANVENYMEYAYCDKMFTPGQADRMRAAVTSTVGGRNNLWSISNLEEVGAIDNPPLCKTDFVADKQVICAGESINFSDRSYNSVSGWEWNFEGGSPASSTDKNPTIAYNVPGTYQVSLTASQGVNNGSEIKTAFITVLPAGTALPFYEGFEAYETLADTDNKWFVKNSVSNQSFEITETAGHTGSKSVKVNGSLDSYTKTSELISSTIDLSEESIPNVTFSYRYAHRNIPPSTSDLLKIYFSPDCGDNWVHRNPATSSLASSPMSSESWVPTAADWITVHIPFNTVAYQAYLTENFRFKFTFLSRGGSPLYIDNINLYKGAPSDSLVVLGLDKSEPLSGVALFPNPSDGETRLTFSLESAQTITLSVTDISGKELKRNTIQATAGKNMVLLDHSEFAAGLYIMQLETAASKRSIRFIKQ